MSALPFIRAFIASLGHAIQMALLQIHPRLADSLIVDASVSLFLLLPGRSSEGLQCGNGLYHSFVNHVELW